MVNGVANSICDLLRGFLDNDEGDSLFFGCKGNGRCNQMDAQWRLLLEIESLERDDTVCSTCVRFCSCRIPKRGCGRSEALTAYFWIFSLHFANRCKYISNPENSVSESELLSGPEPSSSEPPPKECYEIHTSHRQTQWTPKRVRRIESQVLRSRQELMVDEHIFGAEALFCLEQSLHTCPGLRHSKDLFVA